MRLRARHAKYSYGQLRTPLTVARPFWRSTPQTAVQHMSPLLTRRPLTSYCYHLDPEQSLDLGAPATPGKMCLDAFGTILRSLNRQRLFADQLKIKRNAGLKLHTTCLRATPGDSKSSESWFHWLLLRQFLLDPTLCRSKASMHDPSVCTAA